MEPGDLVPGRHYKHLWNGDLVRFVKYDATKPPNMWLFDGPNGLIERAEPYVTALEPRPDLDAEQAKAAPEPAAAKPRNDVDSARFMLTSGETIRCYMEEVAGVAHLRVMAEEGTLVVQPRSDNTLTLTTPKNLQREIAAFAERVKREQARRAGR